MMTRRAWSDADLSAYLDGELDPTMQATLEASIAQDPALRARVEAMKETVFLIRSIPLREPPRNFLLSPSMVREEGDRSHRQKPLLLMMRAATTLVAFAFVITTGLAVLQHRVSPIAMIQSKRMPEAAYSAAPAEEFDRTRGQEMPISENTGEVASEVPQEAATPDHEKVGAALANAPNAAAAEGSVGGAQSLSKENESLPTNTVTEAVAIPKLLVSPTLTASVELNPPSQKGSEPLVGGREVKTVPLWLPVMLGIITIVMIVATIQFSRRRGPC